MPMYFKDDNGYEQVKFNSTNKYHSVYKQVAEYFYKNQIQESTERSKIQREQGINKMSYDVAIHHKNFIKTNNNPENLQVMTEYEHWIYHSKLLKEKWKDPLFRLEQSKRATEHIKKLNKNPTEEEVYQYYEINHKIKKIEYIILEETPVYDLKIKEWENFVVEAGVVLHNCPDMKFRLQYFNTRNKINSTPPQMIPSNITNPHDRLGPGCKHVMMVLSNTSWIMRVASVIKNYITYMERNRENQYAKIIYPAIYGKEYEKPVQVGMFDNKDELETEKQTLDTTNRYARTRTQFDKDNPYRIRPTNRQSQGLVSIEDEIEEKEA